MSSLDISCIIVLVLLAVWIVTRRTWYRFCPACKSRHLREVTTIRSDGTTPDRRGNFTFYRCEACAEALQIHNDGHITVATKWRSFILDNDLSQPTRPNS
jgi:hypothetical protein